MYFSVVQADLELLLPQPPWDYLIDMCTAPSLQVLAYKGLFIFFSFNKYLLSAIMCQAPTRDPLCVFFWGGWFRRDVASKLTVKR